MLICGSDAVLAPGDAAMQDDSTVPAPSGAPLGADAADALDPAERVLAEHLARRYAIASSDIGRFVASAFRAAAEVGLDPLLVLAVISVESSFNPLAESVMGAKGLMQIIPKYHRGKLAQFGGEAAVLDAESNIHVGARILQEYVYRAGTLEGGLQFYNGAYTDGNAQYAQKVMAERRRLLSVLRPPGRI
jgi:soluble lytic murein transglycosylase-like protein